MFLVPFSRQAGEWSRSLERLFDDKLFDPFFAPARGDAAAPAAARSPALDLSENEQAYTVKLDLPGVGKDDVTIQIDGRRVTVEARITRNDEKKDGDRVVYSERSVSQYARSFTLPQDVNEAESTARIEHGVLTLTLAKRGNPQARRISVS